MPAVPASPNEVSKSSDRPLNILLVEDNIADSILVTKLIERSEISADVRVVSDGETALEYLFRRGDYATSPIPDFVLLDLNLPRRSGFEVLTEMRKHWQFSDLPVFILTSSRSKEDEAKAHRLRVSSFLTKPSHLFEFEELIQKLFSVEVPRVLPKYKMKPPAILSDATRGRPQLSEAQFRHFINVVQDYAIFMLDPNGYILSWNDGARRLSGYDTDEVIGKNFSLFFVKVENDEEPASKLKTAIAHGRYHAEGWRLRKDGSRFWAAVVISPVRDQRDELIGFTKMIRDLTETKQRDTGLEEKNRLVKLLQVVASAANEISNPDECLLFCLDRICETIGWDVGHAYFLSPEERILVPSGIWHVNNPSRFKMFQSVTASTLFPPGVGLPGRVLSTGNSVWIPDVNEDPNFPRARVARDIGVKTGFGCPITANREVIGVLEFFASARREPVSELLDVMAHVGTQLGQVYQRKRSENALKDSEERNRLIIETAFSAFIGMDAKGIITEWNRQAEITFGWTRADAIGRPLRETIIPARLREAHEKGLARFLATGEGPILGKRVELTAIHQDGHEFPVELAVCPIDAGGRHFFASFIHDIGGRKKAEADIRESEKRAQSLAGALEEEVRKRAQALEKSEARYRTIFTLAAVGMGQADCKTGKILDINEWMCEFLGYSREELLGMCFADVTYPEDRKHDWEIFQAMVRGEIPLYHNEKRYLRKDGRIVWADVTAKIVRDRSGEASHTVGIVQDITERKLSQKALEEKARELEKSNSELEQFTYVASHDLKEPLRAITTFLQLLDRRSREKLDAEDIRCIDFAAGGAARMQALIEDLLSFGAVGKSVEPREVVDFNAIANEASANLKPLIDEMGARIQIESLPEMRVVRAQVLQLFQNLISNAIKYSGDKATRIKPEIQISARGLSGTCEFSIKDNGIGIRPEYAERIFLPFQRLHSDRQKFPGTGLGLAICKRIVEQHGGRIWVESQSGQGATFFFTIPR